MVDGDAVLSPTPVDDAGFHHWWRERKSLGRRFVGTPRKADVKIDLKIVTFSIGQLADQIQQLQHHTTAASIRPFNEMLSKIRSQPLASYPPQIAVLRARTALLLALADL